MGELFHFSFALHFVVYTFSVRFVKALAAFIPLSHFPLLLSGSPSAPAGPKPVLQNQPEDKWTDNR